jgi:hypothetical protein
MSWPALQIAAVHYGGSGKHLYDVTYHELYMFNWVGLHAMTCALFWKPDHTV